MHGFFWCFTGIECWTSVVLQLRKEWDGTVIATERCFNISVSLPTKLTKNFLVLTCLVSLSNVLYSLFLLVDSKDL